MADSNDPLHAPLTLKAHRDRTIATLCDHFSHDRLTVEEFEQRLDVANRAVKVPQLDALLADLPVIQAGPAAQPQRMPAAHVREQQILAAVMGGVERRGQWSPAQRTFVIAAMGGAVLDFREVVLPPGETVVTVFAMMGGAEIIVPPELIVDIGGVAIMGGFSHQIDRAPPRPANATVLRVDGVALMGGVDVKVRLPGESGLDARHRRREEKRKLREERRRR